MVTNKGEAAQALDEINQAQTKTRIFHRYRNAAPHFMLWGGVWLVGNIINQFADGKDMRLGAMWLVLTVVAIAGMILIGRQQRARMGDTDVSALQEQRARARRMGQSNGLVWLFVIAIAFIFGPPTYRQMNALISLAAGFAYMAFGLWIGSRIFVVGAVISALALLGYYTLGDYYYLWMAFVGGGALFFSGLWLQRA